MIMVKNFLLVTILVFSLFSCNNDDDADAGPDIAAILTADAGLWQVEVFQSRETENDPWIDSATCANDDVWQFLTNGELLISPYLDLCDGQNLNDLRVFTYEVVPGVGYNFILSNNERDLETVEFIDENRLIVTYDRGTLTNAMGRRIFNKF